MPLSKDVISNEPSHGATPAPMEHPFPRSVSAMERVSRLVEVVAPEDSLGILVNADPDAMASALALKRLFWRKVRKVTLYHVNPVDRPDNLAFIRLLKIIQERIQDGDAPPVTRWAVVDSQPGHFKNFKELPFHIIIDHHPIDSGSKALFMDIREDYGANSTIMTEYLRAARVTPSARLATALFYGIKTDTNNFVRHSLPNDINAFRFLYRYVNMNIIKKIESSEFTRGTLNNLQKAFKHFTFIQDTAFVYMGREALPDDLVIIADFFMKLAEANWSIAAGIHQEKLIVILRNAGFKGDAGKKAKRLFEPWGGNAGGHKSAARAEIPLSSIEAWDGNTGTLKDRLLKVLTKGLARNRTRKSNDLSASNPPNPVTR